MESAKELKELKKFLATVESGFCPSCWMSLDLNQRYAGKQESVCLKFKLLTKIMIIFIEIHFVQLL